MMISTPCLDELEHRLGIRWEGIRRAQAATVEKRALLETTFLNRVAPDTSVVLFGSIARGEFTSSSDADWILLVDGQAYPEHQAQKAETAGILHALGFGEPGKSGVFGCMVGSHELVHEIGGEDDTNSNTTRRVLLLLESVAIENDEAYNRVRRQILNRYIRDDRGLLFGSGDKKVPRFLLNDFTRYWRTVTVDFVYKQRADAGRKWALRNAKLRMSRKLVFASGLLRCYFCHLDPAAGIAREQLKSEKDPNQLLTFIENDLTTPPLELLARAVLQCSANESTAKKLFSSYDAFLAILDDERRNQLEALRPDQMASSAVWQQVRELSHDFQLGLTGLFYNSNEALRDLVVTYGVF